MKSSSESNTSVKQVIILRKDLNMRKGKMVAQGAHASMAVLLNRGYTHEGSKSHTIPLDEAMIKWLTEKFTKICVSVDSEQQLLDIYELAHQAKLPCSLIRDSGLTEFGGVPTYTAVAIGPAYSDRIDEITGGLPLL